MSDAVVWFSDTTLDNAARVGGKNTSLDELVRELAGAGVPDGVALTETLTGLMPDQLSRPPAVFAALDSR